MSTDIKADDEQLARRAIGLLDLMALNADDTDQRIIGMCQRALTPLGPVASVCVYPKFVLLARTALDRLRTPDIRVVAAVNFPYGSANIESAASETRAAVMAGADEIDVVNPFRTLLCGDQQVGMDLVAACRDACGPRTRLTVTLETGDLRDPQTILDASRGAILSGADFIKTSTGKVVVSATPQAARIMLESIAEVGGQVGIKYAGGIRTFQDAKQYLDMTQARFGPHWLTAERVRIGASSLLDDLLIQLGVLAPGPQGNCY
ncbi:deoxyribose-phosphate aldolase [Pseudomonas syringae]|uniref:Deoxyribose-phosphate aldolase n=1 Tax=Pseudomonas syringae TaxID=317 RepID=A0A085UMM1_PSESX|nr:deoxyribose-phosphate aldolase [Pseudomonas syringae]KFE44434.1 deoxyribose-phosphate aldolase [Pseudomonas syringae]